MTPEDILSHASRVLTTAQRESYFASGFVTVDGAIPCGAERRRLSATISATLNLGC